MARYYNIMKKLIPLLFITIPLLSAGCVKEDMEACTDAAIVDPLRLDFSFTNNKQGQNMIADDIKDIRVYIFDQESGLLTHAFDIAYEDLVNDGIDVDVPSGVYTIVAWASNSDDMLTDDFQAGYAEDTDNNGTIDNYADSVSINTTSIDDFRMMLEYEKLPADMVGDIVPKVERFDDLYWASADSVSVERTRQQIVHLDFLLNTATFNVRVAGLQHLGNAATRADSDMPLDLFVTGNNGVYKINNVPDTTSLRVRYNSYDGSVAADTMTTHIRSMRLDMADSYDVRLYLQDPDGRGNVLDPMDLMDIILATRDDAGNNIYQSQKALDIETEFNIEISVAVDLTVSVTVNGFEPVVLTPGESDAEKTPNAPNKTE